MDTCSDCHDMPPSDGLLRNSPEGAVLGSHQVAAHKGLYPGNNQCIACHEPPAPASHTHRNGMISMNSTSIKGFTGSYYDKDKDGTKEPSDASFVQNTTPTLGQCRNVYCHSTVQGTTNPTDPPTYKTPEWGTPFIGTCGMGACHAVGVSHLGDTGYAPLNTGGHDKHLNFRYDQSSNCQACHYDYAYSGCASECHNRAGLEHVNGIINVNFHEEFPYINGDGAGTYTGDPAPQTAYGQCSSIYCHSPGNKDASPYDAPNTTPVTWGGSLPGDCTGCHSGDPASSDLLNTGSHEKHLEQYTCDICHGYTANGTRALSNVPYGAGVYTNGQRYHVDGWINIAFNTTVAGSGITYAGSNPQTRSPGNTYSTCANISCHNGGTATWGGTLGCDGCHGYPPAIGDGFAYIGIANEGKGAHTSHVDHIEALTGNTLDAANDTFTGSVVASICGVCHDTSDPANHGNGPDNREISIPASYVFGPTGSPEYLGISNKSSTVLMKSCRNISCHFRTSPGWQDPATAGN